MIQRIIDAAGGNSREERIAYMTIIGKPSALTFFYRKDRPEEWIIIVVKDTHLPPKKRRFILCLQRILNFYKRNGKITVKEEKSIT